MLDPRIHTLEAVRRKSKFLLTAVLSSAAKFTPGYSAAAQRLYDHCNKLIGRTVAEGRTSLETVQAFCIICPWLDSGTHQSVDSTGTYLSIANHKFGELKTPTDELSKRSHERTYLTLYNYNRGCVRTLAAIVRTQIDSCSA